MLSFLLNVMTSTTADNGESSESPGRKSRKLLPRILKDHVISLSKGLENPHDSLQEFALSSQGMLRPSSTSLYRGIIGQVSSRG